MERKRFAAMASNTECAPPRGWRVVFFLFLLFQGITLFASLALFTFVGTIIGVKAGLDSVTPGGFVFDILLLLAGGVIFLIMLILYLEKSANFKIFFLLHAVFSSVVYGIRFFVLEPEYCTSGIIRIGALALLTVYFFYPARVTACFARLLPPWGNRGKRPDETGEQENRAN